MQPTALRELNVAVHTGQDLTYLLIQSRYEAQFLIDVSTETDLHPLLPAHYLTDTQVNEEDQSL